MKKSIYCSLAIILILGITSCSNNKAQSDTSEKTQTSETTKVDKGRLGVDVERVQKLVKQDDISEDDCDFLLDQMELFVDQVEGKSKDEREQYLKSLPQDEQEAMFVIGLGLSAAKKGGKMTDSQLERYNEMESKCE